MALAGELATSPARTIHATESVTAASRIMYDNAIGDVLVVDDDGRLTGIVTDRDITVRVVAQSLDPQTTAVEQVCTKDVAAVEASLDAEAAERLMRERCVHRLPVVNEDRHPIGVISLEDLAMSGHVKDKDLVDVIRAISKAYVNGAAGIHAA